MVLDRLTGVYFSEDVNAVDTNNEDPGEMLQFIVQTSSTISDFDGKLTKTTLSNFKTKVANKGLTKTTAFIEYIMNSLGQNQFFVYSVKTDTTAGWQAAVTSGELRHEITRVIYLEENESDSNNTITAKMGAIITGCNTCATTGGFRVAYVIPDATIAAAVEDASSGTPQSIAQTTLTSILTGIHSGRLCCVVPDNAEKVMATIVAKDYYEEVGYGDLYEPLGTRVYPFSMTQLLAVRNLGVIVPRVLYENGEYHYEIELGVTTNWSQDLSDGLLVARTVADELLREVYAAVRPFVKQGEHASNIKFVQTAIDNVIAEFVASEYVTKEGTQLTVIDEGNMCFSLIGGITPVRTLAVIDISTTLN